MHPNQTSSIAEVRRRTSAPIKDCKKALELNGWDLDDACRHIAKVLHDERALARGKEKQHDSYGTVALYSYEFGRLGVMVELSCESNYVAKSREFIKLANAIAIHIAWSNPRFVDRFQVPPGDVRAAEDELRKKIGEEGWQQFGDDLMEKHFYPKYCLLDQLEIKETQGKETISSMVGNLSRQTGEVIAVKRFARFRIGDPAV